MEGGGVGVRTEGTRMVDWMMGTVCRKRGF